jgi:ABC-type multidrug transport system ATPase subunit
MRREFWHHINAVTQRGVAIVVTTHFMEEAEYCDRIGLIWSGRKIAEGTPDDLKSSVATRDRPEPTLEEAFITLIEREAA